MRLLLTAALLAALSAPSWAETADATGPQPFHVVPADAPTPEATGDATPDPALNPGSEAIAPEDLNNVKRAKEWFTRIQTGDIDREQLTADFSAAMTDEVVQATSARLKPFGDPDSFTNGGKFVRDGISAYVFRVSWKAGSVLYQFAIDDASGKIAGIFTRPAPPLNLTR